MVSDVGPDRRRNVFRDDLAAEVLRGIVEVPQFRKGTVRQVRTAVAPVRRRPEPSAPLDTEALLGEQATVYDEADGWAWGQLMRDGYVGYLPSEMLTRQIDVPTHRVKAVLAIIYSEPSALSLPLGHAPFNAEVEVKDGTCVDGFSVLTGGGYIACSQLVDVEAREPDYVSSALQFLGLPYLYGGKTAFGLDCSGLVQNVLQAAGGVVPRDSDMLLDELGPAVDAGEGLIGLARGDIVFWPGHMGIMADARTIIHANATHASVTLEPICEVAARSRQDGPIVAGVVRPELA